MATQKTVKGAKEPLTFVGGFAINPNTNGNSFSANNRNVVITVVGTGTVVVHMSQQAANKEIDFSAASTADNSHSIPVLADLGALAPNKYVLSAVVAGETKQFELNVNICTQIGIEQTVGTPDVLLTITDNQ